MYTRQLFVRKMSVCPSFHMHVVLTQSTVYQSESTQRTDLKGGATYPCMYRCGNQATLPSRTTHHTNTVQPLARELPRSQSTKLYLSYQEKYSEMSLANTITRSLSHLRLQSNATALTRNVILKTTQLRVPVATTTVTQVRTKITKTKKLRILKKAKAEPKRNPPNYVPKDKPVLVAPTAQRESLAQIPEEHRLTNLLSERSDKMSNETPPLRFNFTNVVDEMSPKVRQLFQLTNGSTNEIAKAQKSRAMELFEVRPGDTGSSAVQIMALTSRIQQMQTHVSTHRKDHSGKRGLDAMYVRRRKLLDYLERKDFDTYGVVVKALGLVR